MALTLISVAVVLVIIVISVVSSRRREKRLAGYSGLSKEEFVEHFAAKNIPRDVSEVVYETFKKKSGSVNFRPSPEMHIEQVFEQLGEDTDDDARHILKALGIPEPSESTLELWEEEGVQTISDLVMWTDWVRHQTNKSAGGPP